jgi:hypothetical protein
MPKFFQTSCSVNFDEHAEDLFSPFFEVLILTGTQNIEPSNSIIVSNFELRRPSSARSMPVRQSHRLEADAAARQALIFRKICLSSATSTGLVR